MHVLSLRNILHMRILILLSSIALLTVNSCKNDGCDDPLAFNYDENGTSSESCIYEPKQISLTVSPNFGGESFNVKDTLDINDGREIIINYFGVYLSNLSIKEKAEDDYIAWGNNDVMLAKDGQLILDAVYVNKSQITGFQFDIGVDTAIYSGDPTDTTQVSLSSPLALQVPSMYWGWAGGYRFVSVEGVVDASAAKDGSEMMNFEFHCGLPANLKTMTMDSNNISAAGNEINLELALDIRALFEGVDFENDDLIIHSGMHPVTIKMMNNSVNAIELK